jgi:methylase of polypeptide subunit release factors
MSEQTPKQTSNELLVYPDIVTGEPIVLKEHEQVWTPSPFGLSLARLIAEQDWTQAHVLDLASGSGILGLVALRKGAKHVTGIDLNPYASDAMAANWKANRFPPETYTFVQSDCFTTLEGDSKYYEAHDLLVCNPPPLPMKPDTDFHTRSNVGQWNEVRDAEGRLVLDAAITQGRQFLKPGGQMLLIATSKAGWRKTQRMLSEHWEKWDVVRTLDLPLNDSHSSYIQMWKNNQEEQRIIEKEDGLYQRVYFIKAIK